jgi:transposase
MEIHAIGIDLGKTLFHLVGVDASGRVVVRKRCSRTQLLTYTANVRVQVIGMEACSGAHFLARALQQQGHEVRLMPAQYVKPYVKTNKSDYIDAEAIAEAVQRPSMRFVPLKTEEQLDLQAVHRVRERWVMRRTAVINQIRGLLLERGITLPKGRSHLEEGLPEILAEAHTRFSGSIFVLLAQLRIELDQLSTRIEEMDVLIARTSKENDACQRLTSTPGVAPVTRPHWWLRSATDLRSEKDAISQPGWDWSPESIPPAANKGCSESASRVTVICAASLCNVRAVSFVSGKGRGRRSESG